ncbi:hypothetical protein F5J12DRAFT_784319 [Pisolithus orientalis]|uniref:uncharacterized protein n=1 Tax=Pisolithus orientalis TaxID=936130 RepID=UPI002224C1E7|nr:uncharacterized protein F5J12DRAFT_784319 [Pisolithus orientalis]KAI6000282.1 hypothetical protein F5J12DRAFT_784319 [Pisolithus orientalis]
MAKLSMAIQYLGIRFHCLVTTMKKPDWSEYQHTSWYQHFLAEAVSHWSCGGAMVDSGTGCNGVSDGHGILPSHYPDHATHSQQAVSIPEQWIKECHVKLATTMSPAWWQNNTGKVELGYERRPLQNIITEATEFFAGVSNSGISLPLLINSHPSPTAKHAALHAMCTEGLKDIDQELSYLSKLILHSQERMSSLEAVT